MTTFLSATNEVLERLRESTVASVTDTAYSKLIGKFVNDAKRQVEDAWNWSALHTVLIVPTVSGSSTLTVTGSGLRMKSLDLNNYTSKYCLENRPLHWILDQQQLGTSSNAQPLYYAWNGNDGTDSKVELYPTPDAVYSLRFNLYVPQATLTSDATVIQVPDDAVIAGAYARALVERGEDVALDSGEAYGLFKGILSDQIAHEAARFCENNEWVAV